MMLTATDFHFVSFHFRQNRHFAKGPFAISFEFLFIVWRLIAISAIFANACISGHISNFSGYEVANADKHTGELEYFQIIMHGQIKQYFRDDFPVKIGLIEFK